MEAAGASRVGGVLVLAALAASGAHLALFLATGQEAYPLTAYPMYADRVARYRAFYDVEAAGPDGASATLAAADLFDGARSLENSVAQKHMGKLRDWQAHGCAAASFDDHPACAGAPVEGWAPPPDLVALWTASAEARLGWAPASFSVLVRQVGPDGESAPTLAFAFPAEAAA